MAQADAPYPPIDDYGFISDCHCTALVSRGGSVDWSCMPRVDSDSCFGRLLDWERGGFCSIAPAEVTFTTSRRYLPETMILETTFQCQTGEARLIDYFAMDPQAAEQARYEMIRIVEGISGHIPIRLTVCPRFDFGEILPMIQQKGQGFYTAIGSNKALIIRADFDLDMCERHDLVAAFTIQEGERRRLSINFEEPERVERADARPNLAAEVDKSFQCTQDWWRRWSGRMNEPHCLDPHSLRSAIVLKALTFERTGAIVAACTTSLPEWIGESRNWDYRYSWVRDSVFTVRALSAVGYGDEAERFLAFILRASAGSAQQLQIMYGVDGKRRLTEVELHWLDGYRQSRPVRIGNSASDQKQLDTYGDIMELAVMWHASGHEIDADYCDFLIDVVNTACEKWKDADHGIWELRSGPRHHVHSKAMCWLALQDGITLAEAGAFDAPLDRWRQEASAIRNSIEHHGYDETHGVFIQAYDCPVLDSSLLLLPRMGFVAYDDPRMVRTAQAICQGLDQNGMLLRYEASDGLRGPEGVFIPCTFWLVSCLARQGRIQQAWDYYRRALECANDLGLFSEESDPATCQMLGNFPQGLTHISQIMARLALNSTGTKPAA
ncbi:glycoside hydrolase family 15 protein [Candidimonas sp. SYP-B2681]|uniref:glycoside hydrolase family 15 protein n=1 Tax=Candidimonas sp. SYP-B2681 TaxID=2497686 RepID=UPI000F879D22|nr:glycoside hydrolase family 15 protein [Candidimonas sp. SYP-B2681]RTZ45715.1 glycoside hydrolase family 15 protein [Candidimonas sp. SYP-B2681]